jgi:hypothetical protein
MTTSIVNTIEFVSLAEAAALIAAAPENIYLVRGEPGIGKSSILKTLAKQLNMPAVYIDVPNMDLGDIAMPVVEHATKTTRYYPNARFQFHLGQPVCIMLDEFSKGADPVKNMLHPLFEVNNPRLGDVPVPKGSIIFLTGNMTTDGVGDNLKAHTMGRITPINVRKSNTEEYIEWAVTTDWGIKPGIAPEVLAWLNKNPMMLASYLDGDQKDNPYIFQPKYPDRACVSPRQLERVSNILNARKGIKPSAIQAAISGTIGRPAGASLAQFIEYSDQLPDWEDILARPMTALVPESPGAIGVLVYGALMRIARGSLTAMMQYLKRLPAEWQAVFVISLAKNPEKQAIAFSNPAFALWCADNQDLL